MFSENAAKSLAFGVPFDRTNKDGKLAADLKAGILELHPHKPWKRPPELEWSEDPFREPNWVVQYHMLRWLDPLRRQANAGDTSGVQLWVDTVLSWINANPPGLGKSRRAWMDMVEAMRAMTMCFGLPMLAEHDGDALAKVVHSIQEHGEWLANPKRLRPGNHGLQQHHGLLIIGAVLERDDWKRLAIDRSLRMLKATYDEQGVNEEGAIQYQLMNFKWWNLLRQKIQLVADSSLAGFERVERAPLSMAHAVRPDGALELIGDTELFRPKEPLHPAIRYVSTNGKEGAPPPDTVKIFDAGYVYGRSGWGDENRSFAEQSFYSLRFGPQNRIHGHADGMSLTLYHGGNSMLVDSGKFAYDDDHPLRAHLLSRAGHNSVSIEGVEYDPSTDVRLERSAVRGEIHDFDFTDAGYAGTIIRRRVVAHTGIDIIVVIDHIESSEIRTAHQWWHLAPRASHRKELPTVLSSLPATRTWLHSLESHIECTVVEGTEDPWQGWQSLRWREAKPTRTVDFSATGLSQRIATVIDFSGGIEAPVVTEHESTVSGVVEIRVVRNGVTDTILLADEWATSVPDGGDAEEFARVAKDSWERN